MTWLLLSLTSLLLHNNADVWWDIEPFLKLVLGLVTCQATFNSFKLDFSSFSSRSCANFTPRRPREIAVSVFEWYLWTNEQDINQFPIESSYKRWFFFQMTLKFRSDIKILTLHASDTERVSDTQLQ